MILTVIVKNIDDDEATVVAMFAEKSTGDGLLIIAVAATTSEIIFGLRGMGVGQNDALITSTTLAWLMPLPVWKG